MKRRAQSSMSLPFGMIFSIILIVAFVIVAFIAARAFLDVGQTTNVGFFYEELQDAVTNAWQSQSSQKTFKVDLPPAIKKICFANLSKPPKGASAEYREIEIFDIYDSNTFLLPISETGGLERKKIDHLAIDKMTADSNPFCVGTENDLLIKKDFYDKNVVIE